MGAPVNGLRAAVVIWHSAAKTKAGAMPDLYVAVQNVSEAPIRSMTPCGTAAPEAVYQNRRQNRGGNWGQGPQTERCPAPVWRGCRLCSCMLRNH